MQKKKTGNKEKSEEVFLYFALLCLVTNRLVTTELSSILR